MESTPKLEIISQVLQTFYRYGSLHPERLEWSKDGDIEYSDVTILVNGLMPTLASHLDGVTFECLRITEAGLLPHYHERTDSVILVLSDGDPTAFEMYQDFPTSPFWRAAAGGWISQIPRKVPHGFRYSTPAMPRLSPVMYIIAATFPEVGENDTIYVEA